MNTNARAALTAAIIAGAAIAIAAFAHAQTPTPAPPPPPAGTTAMEWEHDRAGIPAETQIRFRIYKWQTTLTPPAEAGWKLVDVVDRTEWEAPKEAGTHHYYVTAIADGLESLPSNVLEITVLPGPVLKRKVKLTASANLRDWKTLASFDIPDNEPAGFYRAELTEE